KWFEWKPGPSLYYQKGRAKGSFGLVVDRHDQGISAPTQPHYVTSLPSAHPHLRHPVMELYALVAALLRLLLPL
ncbi:unnamed protein product, partial [Musa acuminata var. zebrina]